MGIFRQSTLLLACSVAASIVLVNSRAQAQGGSEVELAPVVVEGAQLPTDQPIQAATETKIERPAIQKRMVEDFSDIGRRVDAGVNFNERNTSINLRGLQDDRVLTTVDGVRVPWLVDPRDSAKGGLNAFDFDSLSELDIVRGGDSSRYGSGSLGGVVQLRTLDPEDLIEDGKRFGAILKTGYDSADRSWRGNAAIAGRANDTWLLVQGGYRKGHETENMGDVDGYGNLRTEPNPGDYTQRNILAKLHQYVEGGHRFGLTGEFSGRDFEYENMSGMTSSYEEGSFMSGNKIDRKRVSGEYKFESPDKSDIVDTANLNLFWTDQKLSATTDAIRLPDARSFIPAIPAAPPFFAGFPSGADLLYGYPAGPYIRDNWIKQTSYGFNGDASKELDLGGHVNTLRFGGELYTQKTTQFSYGEDNCPDVDWSTIPSPYGPQSCRFLHSNTADMPEVDSTFFGAFLEDDIQFMDGRLTVTPGLRFDWYQHRPKSTPEYQASPNYDPAYLVDNSDSRISPKLRVAYKATPEVTVFAQWAQGFRAPSAQELYENFANAGQYARIGNPDLKPETSNGFEFGAAYETPDFGFSANIFNNYYRNFIEEVTLAPTADFPMIFSSQNLARVQIYGAEVRGYKRFNSNWKAWGSFAYSHGKNTETDEYINSIPPLRAILGLGYEQETWGIDVSTTLAAARDKVSGTGFAAPGYGIVDVTGYWEPEQVKGLRVQAGVYNLFNKKYWNALDVPDGTSPDVYDRYSEPGTTFRLAVTQKF
ncbi:MAG: TonB-dependent hemoglobin/transferrin/lactoferrin family receptor [Rhizobiaceae bacterium]|nr:TonB-dependent hemoglobin/transferrin/lactoferrin family receptor [Rhizobiaceae bacterium]